MPKGEKPACSHSAVPCVVFPYFRPAYRFSCRNWSFLRSDSFRKMSGYASKYIAYRGFRPVSDQDRFLLRYPTVYLVVFSRHLCPFLTLLLAPHPPPRARRWWVVWTVISLAGSGGLKVVKRNGRGEHVSGDKPSRRVGHEVCVAGCARVTSCLHHLSPPRC